MRLSLVLLASLGLGAAACGPMYGEIAVEAPAPVVVAGPPGAVEAAPGVQVITGWHQPMYYVDDGYWYWHDGAWMTYWGGSWVWATPPRVLVGIREPWRHGRVHSYGNVRDHRGSRGASGGRSRPTVRDHRGRSVSPARVAPPRGGSVRGGSTVRDHRRR